MYRTFSLNCLRLQQTKKYTRAIFLPEKVSSLTRTNKTQMVTIIFDSKPTSVLCHMGDFGCGDGGWTPVMKMDGNKVLRSLCQALR